MPPASPTPSPSHDEHLLAEALAAWEYSGEAGFEHYLAAHPSEAETLRARFDSLRATGLLDTPDSPPNPFPEHLGDYTLLERLGSGGMGVVFRAREDSLARDVALKLIRPDEAYFPGAHERFEREVRITAALRHPGIVPVYAHGVAQGIPYFAMELVEGASLEHVLRSVSGARAHTLRGADLFRAPAFTDEPGAQAANAPERARLSALSWPLALADVGLAAARALAHAHACGVLHRDIKPSNLLLARDGRVLVADFGLASSTSATRLTRTRSQMGSLPYLAPELLGGGGASARSDVYGLCVTLYELLALRPPYWNDDTQALRSAIADGNALPLRRIDAGVPADLAAVIELGMDRDPARRYAGPAELASELEAVLAHRPVRARPAGPLLRAQRWIQRHPTRSLALAAALLAAIGTPSLIAWQQARAREREVALNAQLAAALASERTSRDRAERHFGEARDAVMTLLTKVAGEATFREPRLEPLRRDLYERALAFQERLIEEAERSDDDTLRFEAAASAYGAAALQQQFGDTQAAQRSYTRAQALLEPLRALESTSLDVVELGVRLACWRAAHELHEGRLEAALEASERAAELCAHFDELGGFFAAARRLEAQNIGFVALQRLGRDDEALAAARSMWRDARAAAPAQTDVRERNALVDRALAAATGLATALAKRGLRDEARAVLREALALGDGIEPEPSTAASLAFQRALAQITLARHLDPVEDANEAFELEREAIESLEAERAARPASFDVRRLLAEARNNLGTRLATAARAPTAAGSASATRGAAAAHASAAQELDRALELYRELVEQAPQIHELTAKLGACLASRGALELGADDAHARDLLLEAVATLESVPAASSGLSDHAQRIAHARQSLARALRALGDDAAADAVAPTGP